MPVMPVLYCEWKQFFGRYSRKCRPIWMKVGKICAARNTVIIIYLLCKIVLEVQHTKNIKLKIKND